MSDCESFYDGSSESRSTENIESSLYDGASVKSDYSANQSVKTESSLSSEDKDKTSFFKESRRNAFPEPYHQRESSQDLVEKRKKGFDSLMRTYGGDDVMTKKDKLPSVMEFEIDPDLKHSDWCPPKDSTSLTKKGYPDNSAGSPSYPTVSEFVSDLVGQLDVTNLQLDSAVPYSVRPDYDSVRPDKDGVADSQSHIVWPPMLILVHSPSCPYSGSMWIGELLDTCNLSNAVKVFHPNREYGHRPRSIVIFEPSVKGYLECVDLHTRFVEEGKDQYAWEHGRPAGLDELHGFMATGRDMYLFNENLSEKQKVAFEFKSLEEVTGRSPAGSISKEAHQLQLDQQQQLSSARIKLIYSKLLDEERVFKDKFKFISEKTVGGLEKYEAGRARLVEGLEKRKSVLQQEQQQQEMDLKQLHLDALVNMEQDFAFAVRDLIRGLDPNLIRG